MGKHLVSENGVNKLKSTFILLLEQKPYPSITVSEIAKSAGLNRTTFYLFYTNKADLAKDICDSFLDDYIEGLQRII